MHGEIRLGARWDRFEGEQVIRAGRGFVWRASIRMRGMRVSGSDRWIDGAGLLSWKLFGLVRLARADGPDVSKSAAGRMAIEHVWLPSALLESVEAWEPLDDAHCGARVRVGAEVSRVVLEVDGEGRLRSAGMQRHGTPDGPRTPFRSESFGCRALEERRFGEVRIPSRLSAGWYFGTPRYEESGEFFRCVVDDAQFR
ncbi:MAG: hypothetical protein KDC14_06380 [Planctomycetes bacterium]|nr:hypothetical protein [Planctomycetota bacterium]